MGTFVLKLVDGDYGKIHYFDEWGNAICRCGVKAPVENLEPNIGLKISCQKCKAISEKKEKKSLTRKIRVQKRNGGGDNQKEDISSEEELWLKIHPNARWAARVEGKWIGFQRKPIWVENEDFSGYMDMISSEIYPAVEYNGNFKLLEDDKETLIKRKGENPFRKSEKGECSGY